MTTVIEIGDFGLREASIITKKDVLRFEYGLTHIDRYSRIVYFSYLIRGFSKGIY